MPNIKYQISTKNYVLKFEICDLDAFESIMGQLELCFFRRFYTSFGTK